MKIIGRTDTGRVRKTNQDDFSYGNLPGECAWAVVCDGMGGANGGSVASSTAVKAISESIVSGFSPDFGKEEARKLLSDAVNDANKKVFEMSHSEPSLSGMGTTVVACLVIGCAAYIAHAGDSRAYFADATGIRQLTRDHSIVQEMLESGRLTPDEAKIHPQKNIITRALGVENSLNIDFCEAALDEKNAILICTDGLTNNVEKEAVESIVKEYGFENCTEKLIETANENGGTDNITVVVVFK